MTIQNALTLLITCTIVLIGFAVFVELTGLYWMLVPLTAGAMWQLKVELDKLQPKRKNKNILRTPIK